MSDATRAKVSNIVASTRAMDASSLPRDDCYDGVGWLNAENVGVALMYMRDDVLCYTLTDPLKNSLSLATNGADYSLAMCHGGQGTLVCKGNYPANSRPLKKPEEFVSAAEAITYVCSLVESCAVKY